MSYRPVLLTVKIKSEVIKPAYTNHLPEPQGFADKEKHEGAASLAGKAVKGMPHGQIWGG